MKTIESEIWKPVTIKKFSKHYKVSNMGRVLCLPRTDSYVEKTGKVIVRARSGRILKPVGPANGYRMVALCNEGDVQRFLVHRLVAMAFVPGYFPGAQVNHKNGVKQYNCDYNLEWVTASQNAIHSYSVLGREPHKGTRRWNAKLDDQKVREIRKMFLDGHDDKHIAKKYKVHHATIRAVRVGDNWEQVK